MIKPKLFLFSGTSRTVLGPTQPLFNGRGGSFPKESGEGALNIYFHLVLKLQMSGYTLLVYSLHIDN